MRGQTGRHDGSMFTLCCVGDEVIEEADRQRTAIDAREGVIQDISEIWNNHFSFSMQGQHEAHIPYIVPHHED